jgi:hypothetical protein
VHGQSKPPPAIELVQLPKFCYAQFQVPNATGPEFTMPPGCGPGMNHYCSGLVHLVRAKGAGNKNKALQELGAAETDMRYTEGWMKDFPSCPLRSHLAASMAEVSGMQAAYGGKSARK